MTDIMDRPAPTLANQDDDLYHRVCCKDDNLALCGTDVTHHAWGPPRVPICMVCDEMDLADSCPVHGRCLEAWA